MTSRDIVSVWNWNTGKYDYYRVPAFARRAYGAEIKPPPVGASLGGIGEDPDTSSYPLPDGAQRVGSGQDARGSVVSMQQASNGVATVAAIALAIVVPIALLAVTVNIGKLIKGQEES